jgi:hypothetical protein
MDVMWVTEEVSLVEFYQSGLSLAKEAGYDVVMCFVAREADAPRAYDDLIKAWQSIDDLTGPKILFLFAGKSVRAGHESENIYRQGHKAQHQLPTSRLLFSPDILMLHSSRMHSKQMRESAYHWRHGPTEHYDLDILRQCTEDKSPIGGSNAELDYILARRRPTQPRRRELTERQTPQIRELRDYLSLDERDVPCLHFTFLDGSASIHFKISPQMNIYMTLKSLVESIESDDVKRARDGLAMLTQRKWSLIKEKQDLERKDMSSEQEFSDLTSSLEKIADAQIECDVSINEMAAALRSHVVQPTKEARRDAFDKLQAARTTLDLRSEWKLIRPRVQRIIDIASDVRPLDLSPEHVGEKRRQAETKKASLLRIEREMKEIVHSQKTYHGELHSVLSPKGIREKVNMTISATAKTFLRSFVVVAAGQELEAVRSYLDAEGAKRKTYPLSDNWSVEQIRRTRGKQIEFCLAIAPGQGTEDMGDLLDFLRREAAPSTVILVGMMAGIPGRSGLLDVQAPRNIINGMRLGTRSGKIVPEPHGRDVDPVLHNRLQAMDRHRQNIDDIRLVTHKHSICVAAKFDDLTPELAQATLAADPENIIGIEMEGSALTARQASQRRSGDSTGYLMIKGVADYAGDKATQEEIRRLKSALESSGIENATDLLANPDPTTNKPLKAALQRIATVRAMRVALALMEEGAR